MGKLNGKVAVNHQREHRDRAGIGAAFLAEGAMVVINGRDPGKGEKALNGDERRRAGPLRKGDVTVREDGPAVVARCGDGCVCGHDAGGLVDERRRLAGWCVCGRRGRTAREMGLTFEQMVDPRPGARAASGSAPSRRSPPSPCCARTSPPASPAPRTTSTAGPPF